MLFTIFDQYIVSLSEKHRLVVVFIDFDVFNSSRRNFGVITIYNNFRENAAYIYFPMAKNLSVTAN